MRKGNGQGICIRPQASTCRLPEVTPHRMEWYTLRTMARSTSTATTTASAPARRLKSPAFGLGMFGLGLAVTVGAILLGRSDTGQIDVAAAVRQADSQQTNPAGAKTDLPPASNEFRNVPNGGLVPQGGRNTAPAPAPEDDAATSTDEVVPQTDGDTATEESALIEGEIESGEMPADTE